MLKKLEKEQGEKYDRKTRHIEIKTKGNNSFINMYSQKEPPKVIRGRIRPVVINAKQIPKNPIPRLPFNDVFEGGSFSIIFRSASI